MITLRFLGIQTSPGVAAVFELKSSMFVNTFSIGKTAILPSGGLQWCFSSYTSTLKNVTLDLETLNFVPRPMEPFEKSVLKNFKELGNEVKNLSGSVTELKLKSSEKSLEKKDLNLIFTILQDGQHYFYLFLVAGIFLIFVYSLLWNLKSASVNKKAFNQPNLLEMNKSFQKESKLENETETNQRFVIGVLHFFKEVKDLVFFLKLVNFRLLIPTKLLKESYCSDLYQKQKNNINSFTLEELIYRFLTMRIQIVLQIKQVAINCFFIGLSPLSSRITLDLSSLFFKIFPSLSEFIYQNSITTGWAKQSNVVFVTLSFVSINQYLLRPLILKVVEENQNFFISLQDNLLFSPDFENKQQKRALYGYEMLDYGVFDI